jgi:AraC-like DNA-binding protein
MSDIQKEITPISNEDLFIVLDHPNAKFDYAVHYHSDYEINLVLNDRGKRIVGDSIEPFTDLDLVMTGPNLPHAWRGDIIEGNHVITIQFSNLILNYPIVQKRLFIPIKQLLIESQRGLTFADSTRRKVGNMILELTKTQGFHSVVQFFTILHELSVSKHISLVSNLYDTNETILTTKSRRIAKVCTYIENNINEPIKLSEVATLVNMSESAFSHFFKKKTNCTFINYVNNLRITKASKSLMETNDTIAEVCYSSGFNNLSNFIRTFKKQKGMTPNEYRLYLHQMVIKY